MLMKNDNINVVIAGYRRLDIKTSSADVIPAT